ncbi:MAG: hypothetical protein ACRDHZ_06665 [Ktedonobacteraceae bacterium]
MTHQDSSRLSTSLFSRLWWVWSAIVGFLCCHGWDLVFNFEEWRYDMFMHPDEAANSITIWLILGPLPGAILAMLVVGCIRWWRKRKKTAQ